MDAGLVALVAAVFSAGVSAYGIMVSRRHRTAQAANEQAQAADHNADALMKQAELIAKLSDRVGLLEGRRASDAQEKDELRTELAETRAEVVRLRELLEDMETKGVLAAKRVTELEAELGAAEARIRALEVENAALRRDHPGGGVWDPNFNE